MPSPRAQVARKRIAREKEDKLVPSLEFKPVRSLIPLFTATPEKQYIFVVGPIGSTKTTSLLMFTLKAAAQQEKAPDGFRYTRYAIIRNTIASLKQTILKDALALFGQIAEWRASENTLRFTIGDIRSEWIFLPLEDENDQRRLLSLPLTGVLANECREIDWKLLMMAFSRTGRYPDMQKHGVKCSWRFLAADSNLGVEGSDFHNFVEEHGITQDDRLRLTAEEIEEKEKLHDSLTLYIHQPSALSTPEHPDARTGEYADWLGFLPDRYYETAMVGATREWIKQHVKSEWGMDLSGQPVYGGSFVNRVHVAPGPLKVFRGLPLILGFDPGLNPACVVTQVRPNGQLAVLAELHASNVLFRPFVSEHVIPLLQQLRFQECGILAVMDPAGASRSTATKDTALGILQEYNFNAHVARTNDLSPRLRAVERYLVEMRGADEDGELIPAMIIDPSCQAIISGFEGKYRYVKKKVSGEMDDKPEKKHPISDVHDCLQYCCMEVTRNVRRMAAFSRPARAQPSALAWT